MRSTDEHTPIREYWTARAAGGGDEAMAGALLRAAAQHGPIGERKLTEIHARLRQSQREDLRAAEWPAKRILRQLALATGFVLFGGALSASVMHVLHKASEQPADRLTEPANASKKAVRNPSRRPARPAESVPPSEAPEVPAPTSAQFPAPTNSVPADPTSEAPSAVRVSPPVTRPRPSRMLATSEVPNLRSSRQGSASFDPHQSRGEPAGLAGGVPLREGMGTLPALAPLPVESAPATGPAPGPSQLARESRLLASAIAKLRQDGDPAQALAILDQHRSVFGSGVLAPEANAVRIEALLRLGRNGQALTLLDGQRLSAKGVGREMLVARAELRADKGRCSTALRDFDLILSTPGATDGISERALYGRATCRAKGGDWDGARRDFEKYISDFPRGRYAREARSALAQQLH